MDNISDIPFRRDMDNLFRKMPVMDTNLFMRSLSLISGYSGTELSWLSKQYIRNGIVLVSENGYVTTKFSLPVVTKGLPKVAMSGDVRVEAFALQSLYKGCIDCYYLILDLYPASEHFRLSDSLFPLSFVHQTKGLIYEFIRIPKNQEEIYRGILLKDAETFRDDKFESTRMNTRRIAVVESPACARYIPYVGFSAICVNERNEKGYRIVEKRKEDTWKDLKYGQAVQNGQGT